MNNMTPPSDLFQVRRRVGPVSSLNNNGGGKGGGGGGGPKDLASLEEGPGKKTMLKKPLEIFVDGPFGAPSSNIFRAEHAVLIGTGIGVTPFASILQSIMHRYWQVKRQCPRCDYQWSDDISPSMFNLKKVCTFSLPNFPSS